MEFEHFWETYVSIAFGNPEFQRKTQTQNNKTHKPRVAPQAKLLSWKGSDIDPLTLKFSLNIERFIQHFDQDTSFF